MAASPWQSGRVTWADAPALMLAGVSAVTVTTGARPLRGQGTFLMLALGAGVAGATFVLEKLLVERISAVRPRQSLPSPRLNDPSSFRSSIAGLDRIMPSISFAIMKASVSALGKFGRNMAWMV